MKFSLCEILHFIFLQFSAHRAAPLDAPENTIKAIHKAKKAGAKTIHCDLTFTSDGQAFAIRPSQLNELNKDVQDKEASNLTSKEVLNLDVASNHPLKDEFSPGTDTQCDNLRIFLLL